MVLLTVSSPMLTFSVMPRSPKCITVAPSVKSLLKRYCASRPSRVLRCMENMDWFSSVTLTEVPDSTMLWLVMVTMPML